MRIGILGLGLQSRSKAVTAARMQNFFTEMRPMGEKALIVAYGMPGLDLFGTAGDTPWRGAIPVEETSFSYGVHRGTFYQIDNTGALTSRGTLLTTSGWVYMCHNGTVVLMTDGTYAYTYTIASTTFAQVTDVNLIANPTTCTWSDQWFMISSPLEFQISADGTTWNAADVGAAESNPDSIVRIIADHGELTIFGDVSTEFWTDTGATDFPFAPIKSSTAEYGCAAPMSICKFNDSLAFLSKNRMGQVSVSMLQGYVPRPISTPDVDSTINGYTTVGDATASSFMLGGHPMYQINFPSADASWLYDALTGMWFPRKSYGTGRQRCELGINYLNKTIFTDSSNGNLYKLNPDTYTENGAVIEGEVISENVAGPDLTRFNADRLRVDMETGIGTTSGQGSDPQMMLQVSRDSGQSYGAEMWRSLGKLGDYRRRVEWRRLGASDEFVFKLRITDPVKRVIVSAMINPPD